MANRSQAFMASAMALLLLACSPALNWREVRPDGAGLMALFPSRPDQGVQSVALGALVVKMSMMGCEAGGAMFTLAHVALDGSMDAEALRAQWQVGTLASMQGTAGKEEPFFLKGASSSLSPGQIRATGQRADGSPVAMRAAWFAVGGVVYQAAVYADRDVDEVAQTYFDGIRVD
jgi:hypothetical protein